MEDPLLLRLARFHTPKTGERIGRAACFEKATSNALNRKDIVSLRFKALE